MLVVCLPERLDHQPWLKSKNILNITIPFLEGLKQCDKENDDENHHVVCHNSKAVTLLSLSSVVPFLAVSGHHSAQVIPGQRHFSCQGPLPRHQERVGDAEETDKESPVSDYLVRRLTDSSKWVRVCLRRQCLRMGAN